MQLSVHSVRRGSPEPAANSHFVPLPAAWGPGRAHNHPGANPPKETQRTRTQQLTASPRAGLARHDGWHLPERVCGVKCVVRFFDVEFVWKDRVARVSRRGGIVFLWEQPWERLGCVNRRDRRNRPPRIAYNARGGEASTQDRSPNARISFVLRLPRRCRHAAKRERWLSFDARTRSGSAR